MKTFSAARPEETPPDASQGASAPSFLSPRRVAIVASMVVLYLLYVRLYDQVVVPVYAYGSFISRPVTAPILQLGAVILSGMLLPANLRKMSDLFVWLCMLFILLPAAVLSAREGMDPVAMLLMFGGVATVKLLCNFYARFTPALSNPETHSGNSRVAMFPLLAIHLGVLLALGFHVGGALNFSFQDVYDYRFDFNASLYFPLNYLLPFAAGPLAGMLAAIAIDRKNYPLLGAVMFAGLLFFGFSSHKALMFNPPFAVIGYFTVKGKNGLFYLIGVFALLTVMTMIASGSTADLLGSSFANRLVFIPAQIHFYFFREFQDLGYQYWAESRFGLGLMKSRLPIDSVNYIGLVMAGDAAIGANTGWIANGYMNAGALGIGVYALILSVVMHFLDLMGARHGQPLVGAAFLIPMLNIVNAMDLLAGFLTGGLLLALIAFAGAVRTERPPEPRQQP